MIVTMVIVLVVHIVIIIVVMIIGMIGSMSSVQIVLHLNIFFSCVELRVVSVLMVLKLLHPSVSGMAMLRMLWLVVHWPMTIVVFLGEMLNMPVVLRVSMMRIVHNRVMCHRVMSHRVVRN